MSFRKRLAFFLIATLIGVQALTALFTYDIIRSNLVEQGKRQLKATASVFMRQLNVLSERVSDDVEVLSLDYALRKAVAEQDRGTMLSALRNHGNRIGATRMMLVGLDGNITTDTTKEDAVGAAFPFSDLIETASAKNQGTSLAVLDGGIDWIIATDQQNDHLAMMARLTTTATSRPVVAILDYPLEEALSTYRAVITPMLLVLAAALGIALVGAMLIAR